MRPIILALVVLVACAPAFAEDGGAMGSSFFSLDADSDHSTRGTAIGPSAQVTVNTAAKYTDSIFVGDSEFISVGITVTPTETVSVAVEIQAAIKDADGTYNWASFNSSATRTFTTTTTEVWVPTIGACEEGLIRLKFGKDSGDSQYTIDRCKLYRFKNAKN